MLIPVNAHCGNIAFALTWDPDPAEIPARACSCSFCAKHGGVWTSNPHRTLERAIRDSAHVARYPFATRTADFLTCKQCGVVPVVVSRIEDRLYAVVNVNTFEGIDPSLLRRVSTNFDGEGNESRLARRQRNWIADVRYVERSIEPQRRRENGRIR